MQGTNFASNQDTGEHKDCTSGKIDPPCCRIDVFGDQESQIEEAGSEASSDDDPQFLSFRDAECKTREPRIDVFGDQEPQAEEGGSEASSDDDPQFLSFRDTECKSRGPSIDAFSDQISQLEWKTRKLEILGNQRRARSTALLSGTVKVNALTTAKRQTVDKFQTEIVQNPS